MSGGAQDQLEFEIVGGDGVFVEKTSVVDVCRPKPTYILSVIPTVSLTESTTMAPTLSDILEPNDYSYNGTWYRRRN